MTGGTDPFDLAVVGGGIIGACCTYLAVERGMSRVLLIDRSRVCAGATRYSAGLASNLARTPTHRAWAGRSRELYDSMIRRGVPLPVRTLASYYVVSPAARVRLDSRSQDGPMTEVDPAAVPELAGCGLGLTLPPGDVCLRGAAVSCGPPAEIGRHLVEAAVAGGRARVLENTHVDRLEGLDPVGLVTNDGQRLLARRVVITTGPWLTGGPAEATARTRQVRVKRVVALHLDSPPPPDAPLIYLFDSEAFLLPRPQSRDWLLSITCDGEAAWDVSPDGLDNTPTSADLRQAEGILSRYGLACAARWRGASIFCDAYPPDRTPFVSPDPGCNRAAVVGGGSGAGYRLAPAMAEAALDLLAENE